VKGEVGALEDKRENFFVLDWQLMSFQQPYILIYYASKNLSNLSTH
jgi:hypothetical protein